MERIRGLKRSGVVTVLLFLVAVGLLLAGGIGAVRAAVFSKAKDDYDVEIDLYNIHIRILENGTAPDEGILLTKLVSEGEKFETDKTYDEVITIQNPGTIDEYIKVTVRKYWEMPADSTVEADNKLIKLTLDPKGKWIPDKSSTEDVMVFYYKDIVKAGETTEPLISKILVEGVEPEVVQEQIDENHTKLYYTYEYDGASVILEVEADGIQTHNAEDAILYKWGVSMSVGSDGSLSLN